MESDIHMVNRNFYASIDSAWVHHLQALIEQPIIDSEKGPMHELTGVAFQLDPTRCVLLNPRRCISPAYASAELLWYLGRSDDVGWLTPYAPQYAQFGDTRRRAYGAYGYRLERNIGITTGQHDERDQLDLAFCILQTRPITRQCWVSLWRPYDLAMGESTKDLPCTIGWQFLVRDNALNMVAYMRSNDAWLGTPYDVYTFCSIQKLLAGDLGLKVGTYHHHVGSFHLYDKNFGAAKEAAIAHNNCKYINATDRYSMQSSGMLGEAVDTWRQIREGKITQHTPSTEPCDQLINDSLICIARHHGIATSSVVQSEALGHALNNWEANRCSS